MCCPFTVKVKCNSGGDLLTVTSMVSNHNHDINKITGYLF